MTDAANIIGAQGVFFAEVIIGFAVLIFFVKSFKHWWAKNKRKRLIKKELKARSVNKMLKDDEFGLEDTTIEPPTMMPSAPRPKGATPDEIMKNVQATLDVNHEKLQQQMLMLLSAKQEIEDKLRADQTEYKAKVALAKSLYMKLEEQEKQLDHLIKALTPK